MSVHPCTDTKLAGLMLANCPTRIDVRIIRVMVGCASSNSKRDPPAHQPNAAPPSSASWQGGYTRQNKKVLVPCYPG